MRTNADSMTLADVEQTKALVCKTWRSRLYGFENIRVFIGSHRLHAFKVRQEIKS